MSDQERRAEALAAALPPLLVQAERLAALVWQGGHGRRQVGAGESFWQYRPYAAGDSVTAIDWRKSAKGSGRGGLLVREREWSVAQSLWLWRDGSTCMDWASAPGLERKQARAEVLLLALAALALRGGEKVALAGDDLPPASGRIALPRLAARLASNVPAQPHLFPAPPRHGVVVLFSDFLRPLSEIEAALRRLRAPGVTAHLVQIIDPAEESFPYRGRVRFFAAEGEGGVMAARAEDWRADYRARFAAQCAGVADLARTLGLTLLRHHTDQPPATALLALHQHLAERPGLEAGGGAL